MKLEAGSWKLLISSSPPSGCERNPAPRRAIRQRLPVTAAGSQTKSKFSHGQNVPSVTPMPNLAPGCIRSALKTPAVTTSGPLGRPGRAFETAAHPVAAGVGLSPRRSAAPSAAIVGGAVHRIARQGPPSASGVPVRLCV